MNVGISVWRNQGCNNRRIIGFVLLVNVFLIYMFLYLDIMETSKCAEFFERPHERHRIRLRPVQHSLNIKNLAKNDYQKIVDFEDFSFIIINKTFCDNSGIFLLILVSSDPKHIEHRENIRTTWGSTREGVKVLFLLGLVADELMQEEIENENKFYGDIVQGNFKDSYTNLTYKTVMSLKYVVYHCLNAPYILKMDDDSFVNTPLLLNFLKNDLSPFGAAKLFLCNDMTGSPVIRNNRSKWYVSEEEYPEKVYPSYCSGWYVLLSPDVCLILYEQAQKLKYLFVDDAFVYGIAASKVPNLKHTDISKYTLAYNNPNFLFNGTYNRRHILFGSPNMNRNMVKRFWEYFQSKPVPLSIQSSIV